MARPGSSKYNWSNPQTVIYADNYGYGMNYYQPMIDYIDKKHKGIKTKPPHLPWTNERGLERYSSRNLVQSYSDTDLSDISRRTEASAKNYLRDFKSSSASNFHLSKSVSASKITESIEIEKTKRKKHQLFKKIKYLKSQMADAMDYNPNVDQDVERELRSMQKYMRGKSARAIESQLLSKSRRNIAENIETDINNFQNSHSARTRVKIIDNRFTESINDNITQPLVQLNYDLKGFNRKTAEFYCNKSKQTSLEIEQLSSRVVEAETKLKSEVARIKKKLQIQITELEMSLDVANKTNIDLQKTIKRQSLSLTEITAQYEEITRQLAITMDSLSVTQRKYQALTAECEEIRGNYEAALRGKKAVELQYEEAHSRINELGTVNANLFSTKSKLEQELQAVAADYEEITKELRISDERYQRVQVEIKHTVELLHEEQERVVKIEAIKKSLEIEVKNLSVRLEEVEANAIVGGKRIIGKLEARIRDCELELDEEKRRHAETIKILRKKERTVKEVMIQCEEDQKTIALLSESLDKSNQKLGLFKRQLSEQEGVSQQSVTRVRRFQRELEAAEDRADTAESNLSLIRAKHRTFVTTSGVPGSQVYLVQETRTSSSSTTEM